MRGAWANDTCNGTLICSLDVYAVQIKVELLDGCCCRRDAQKDDGMLRKEEINKSQLNSVSQSKLLTRQP